MQLKPDFHRIIDEYLDSTGEARGRAFAKKQRARIHEIVPDLAGSHPRRRWFRVLWEAIEAKSQDERLPLLKEFVTMALFEPGQRYPIPDAIVCELVGRASDDELCDVLDQVVCAWFSNGGAYSGPDRKRRRNILFDKLPRGLRVAHNLTSLESEVYNGGFVQYFGNSSGRFAGETLEDCRLVGAVRKAALLRRAMTLHKTGHAAIEKSCKVSEADPFTLDEDSDDDPESEMDRLASAYYALENAEPIYGLVAAYVLAHPEKCMTARHRPTVKKRRK